ncbi:hypothetical protein TDB9533_00374 [Thalassocella blandensis]|nr:hypothetical protein TDB9533_00374 [Thalassocella blandensis]
MLQRKKLWASMQAVTLAGIVTLEGCSTENEPAPTPEKPVKSAEAEKPATQHVMPEGEGEGEGEGANPTIDLATDDLAYLTQLALMRGHLYVGFELYQAGHIDHSKTHMKHPKSELYADVVPAFTARGAMGFADELSALSQTVEAEKPAEDVTQAYQQLQQAITASESKVDPGMASLKQKLLLVVNLLRVAGEEYGIAVVDGKMENAHEYQDALGFTTISKDILSNTETGTETEANAKTKATEILAELNGLWPSIVPPETLTTEAGQLYGAASRIEIIALGL